MNQYEFLKTIHPFKDKLFRLAKRLLVSTEEAEDATQEIFVKLWNKNESLRNITNIEAFAVTLTKNYCFDKLKSKQSQVLKLTTDDFENNDYNLQKKLEDKDSLDWIEKIMDKLPNQQKIIIQLRDIEGYEFEEIAKILDMNETAIRVALSRARKTIKELMTKIHNYGTS